MNKFSLCPSIKNIYTLIFCYTKNIEKSVKIHIIIIDNVYFCYKSIIIYISDDDAAN